MEISELKNIASRRSKGPWRIESLYLSMPDREQVVYGQPTDTRPTGYPIAYCADKIQADFIVVADSHFDALLEVAEAAKEFARITAFIPETHDTIRSNLLRAIAKLEGIEG